MMGREWALFRASPACPRCLADSGGVWPVWWRLGVAAACPRHLVLLVDRCPGCGLRLRRGSRSRGAGVLRGVVADPLVCGNGGPTVRQADDAGHCVQRLDQLPMTLAGAKPPLYSMTTAIPTRLRRSDNTSKRYLPTVKATRT